ncbi:MAG: alkaline phosphatase [Candidatus Hermodarchaeota archaeon]
MWLRAIPLLLILFFINSAPISNIVPFNAQYSLKENLYCRENLGNSQGKNIILMIGDGMGFEHLKLARWVELGKEGHLSMEYLPLWLNVTTFSANNPITDSAAAATAFATGNKTNNGMLGVSPSLNPLETILEIAQSLGKSTGLVTTTEISHATPAAFMTHLSSRYNTSEITRQIIEEAHVDVLMGGGKGDFSSTQFTQMDSAGYSIIESRSELETVQTDKVLGLFASGHMPYEVDRNRETTPSLVKMTEKAIEILSQDPDGFFLMIEGGRIDHAGHANNKVNVALETIEFDQAVDVAFSYANTNPNTLLLVTADHETGGLSVLADTLNSTLPLINRSADQNELLRVERANNISVSWTITGHTSQTVPLFGYGLDLSGFENHSLIDNTEIFDIMSKYYSLDTKAPNITLISPSNITYFSNNISLNFTADEAISWIAYSLDNHNNITITSNTTLDLLSEGSHFITLYANDTSGNIGNSITVWFTINIPDTLLIDPLLFSFIVVLVVMIVVLTVALIYQIRKGEY